MFKIELPSFLNTIQGSLYDKTRAKPGCTNACEKKGECTNCEWGCMDCQKDCQKACQDKCEKNKQSSNSGSSSSSSNSSSNNSSSSSSSSGSWKPSEPYKPPNIGQVDKDKVTTGTVVIKNPDGTETTIKDAPLYDGAFYDPATGDILGDTHGPNGKFDKDDYDKDFIKDKDGNVTGIFTPKPQGCKTACESSCQSSCQKSSQSSPCTSSCEKSCQSSCQTSSQSSSSSCSACQNSCQTACEKYSQVPPKIEWNEPFPTFSANLKRIYRYAYHLGVDEAVFSSVTYEESSACVTPLIEVGTLKEKEYLMLEADFVGNIEFYFIDGSREIPILPVGQSKIEDEKMFYGLPLRFIVDEQYPVKVKQNNITIDTDCNLILNDSKYWTNDNKYTATYVPVPQDTYTPIESHIQIKAIIRGIGTIKRMSIRYYGENYYID